MTERIREIIQNRETYGQTILTYDELDAIQDRSYQKGFEDGNLVGEQNARCKAESEAFAAQMKTIDSITNPQTKCHTNRNL